MNYKRLEIPELILCEPKIHEDNRGFVFEAFKKKFIVNIKIDRYFTAGQSIGIRYDDEYLNIDWKIPKELQILSNADEKLLNFNNISSPFDYNVQVY